MPVSQKFLRMPSRRQRGSSDSRANNIPTSFDEPSFPHNQGQGKANRVLGTSQSSRSLHTKPSLVSITVSEANSEALPQTGASRRIQPRPSSPLLGDKYGAASASTVRDKSIREYGSSSTLNSYYDAHKSPLAVSQQTSESSARDYALRKGHPPVISRPGQLEPASSTKLMPSHSSSSQKKDSKKKPSHIDLSMLFPRPKPSNSPLLSPQRYTNSPSPLSTAGSEGYPPTSSMKMAMNRLSKTPRAKDVQQSKPQRVVNMGPDPLLAKVNVRKPKRGVQNWFDLEDLSEEDEKQEQPTADQDVQQSKPRLPTSRHDRRVPVFSPRMSSGSRVSDAGTIPVVLDVPGRGRQFAHSNQLQPQHAKRPSPPSHMPEDRSIQRERSRTLSTRSVQSHTSTIRGADLQKDSILSLSSSDESEGEMDREEPLRSPVLRHSVLLHPFRDSDVEVGTAQVVRTGAPQSGSAKEKRLTTSQSLEQISRFSNISSSTNGTIGQTSPTVPERHSSRNQNQSSLRSSNATLQSNDLQTSTPSQPIQQEEVRSPHGPSRQSSTISQQSLLERRQSTRVMRVTRQEESLLAAMRLKKANMRRAILTEAYHTALEEEEEAALALDSSLSGRPKTSGDNRSSVADSTLALDKRTSIEMNRPRTAEGRQSLGPEDFALLNTAMAPPPPPSSYHHSQSDAATSSRRGSTMHSESLPSPSTSRASPVTPTVAHIPPLLPVPIPSGRLSQSYGQQSANFTKLGQLSRHRSSRRRERDRPDPQEVGAQKKPVNHEQTRIRSILDDLDDAAEDAVNLDDFPVWAAKGWVGDGQIGGDVTVVPS